MMQRKPITSSNICSVGYDPHTDMLEIEFASGSLYRYSGVPADVYHAMLDVEREGASVGTFFARFIKPRFACKRVVTKEAA